jgi:hypothetical protein
LCNNTNNKFRNSTLNGDFEFIQNTILQSGLQSVFCVVCYGLFQFSWIFGPANLNKISLQHYLYSYCSFTLTAN